jgi:hypothetical protein
MRYSEPMPTYLLVLYRLFMLTGVIAMAAFSFRRLSGVSRRLTRMLPNLLIVYALSACGRETSTPTADPLNFSPTLPAPIAQKTEPVSRLPSLSPSITSTPRPDSSPAPTPACLEQAAPRRLPPRKNPLEVKYISDGNIWYWNEKYGSAFQITDTGDARSFSL